MVVGVRVESATELMGSEKGMAWNRFSNCGRMTKIYQSIYQGERE